MRVKLLLLSACFLALFTIFSYTVAKEAWNKFDFDTTVKLQDHLSRRFDKIFSYFSLLGSIELTLLICLLFSISSLFQRRWLASLAWFLIIPASFAEVFGKLILYHPAPPEFFHRSIFLAKLPSFYIHTNFSYPSGHITRTFFIVSIFILTTYLSVGSWLKKSFLIGCLLLFALAMAITRIYLGEHWFSDVLGGVLLGIASGLFASIFILTKKSLLPR